MSDETFTITSGVWEELLLWARTTSQQIAALQIDTAALKRQDASWQKEVAEQRALVVELQAKLNAVPVKSIQNIHDYHIALVDRNYLYKPDSEIIAKWLDSLDGKK